MNKFNLLVIIFSIYLLSLLSFTCDRPDKKVPVDVNCINNESDYSDYNVILINDDNYLLASSLLVNGSINTFCNYNFSMSPKIAPSFSRIIEGSYNEYISPLKKYEICNVNPLSVDLNQKHKECVCAALSNYPLEELQAYARNIEPVSFNDMDSACTYYFNKYKTGILDLRNDKEMISYLSKYDISYFSENAWTEQNKFDNKKKIVFTNLPIIQNDLGRITPDLLLRAGVEIAFCDHETKSVIISTFPVVAQSGYFSKYGRCENPRIEDLLLFFTDRIHSQIMILNHDCHYDYTDSYSIMFPPVQFEFWQEMKITKPTEDKPT